MKSIKDVIMTVLLCLCLVTSTTAAIKTGVIAGPQGIQGEQGLQGEKGERGEKGDQGIQGEKGDKGDQGIQGIQGIQGEQGLQGVQGIQGEKGDRGEQGIQGEKGKDGECVIIARPYTIDQKDDGKYVYNLVLTNCHILYDQNGFQKEGDPQYGVLGYDLCGFEVLFKVDSWNYSKDDIIVLNGGVLSFVTVEYTNATRAIIDNHTNLIVL